MSAPPTTVLFDVQGPQARRVTLLASVLGGLVLLLVVLLALRRLQSSGQLASEKWSPLVTSGPLWETLGRGVVNTLRAAAVAMVLALALGAVLALGRLSRRRWVSWPVGVVVEFFRGLPVLLLILFAFLGLPAYGVRISPFTAVVAGLSVYNGAVLAEVFRAGILSLPRGQSEAAYALGLSYGQVMRLVLVPQAVRRMLPAVVSQLVTLLKDTSLGFIVSYEELLRRGSLVGEFFSNQLQMYLVVGAMFIAVNYSLSRLATWLERRQSRRYGGAPAGAATEDVAALEAVDLADEAAAGSRR